VDLTLSLLKLADKELSLNAVKDVQLKISPIVLDMQLTNAPTLQLSLELGADKSFKLNALQELKDSNQTMFLRDVIVMDNHFTDVDLTLLQISIAETNLLKNV
jgi:hypothetical protein